MRIPIIIVIVLKKSSDVQAEERKYEYNMMQSEFLTKPAEERNDEDATVHSEFL